MSIYCIYCTNELHDDNDTGTVDCSHCSPTKVRYIYATYISGVELWFIQLRIYKCMIQIDPDWKVTSIFTGPIYKEKSHLITLDYIADINPQTAVKFAHRYLKLKAFV